MCNVFFSILLNVIGRTIYVEFIRDNYIIGFEIP